MQNGGSTWAFAWSVAVAWQPGCLAKDRTQRLRGVAGFRSLSRFPVPWQQRVQFVLVRLLSGGPVAPYSLVMDDVTLPPELERFAEEAVAAGRYRDLSDVVAAGVSLLQRQEQARAELLASVLAAKEESDREGYLTGEEVATRVRATIARATNAEA